MVDLPLGEGWLPGMVGPVCLFVISGPVLLHVVLCVLRCVHQESFLGIGDGRGGERSLFSPFCLF